MNLQSEIERVLNESFSEGSKTTHSIVTAEIMELIKRAEIDTVFEDAKKEKTNYACVSGKHNKCPQETDEFKCICDCHSPQKIEEIGQLDFTFDSLCEIHNKINELVIAHNKYEDFNI